MLESCISINLVKIPLEENTKKFRELIMTTLWDFDCNISLKSKLLKIRPTLILENLIKIYYSNLFLNIPFSSRNGLWFETRFELIKNNVSHKSKKKKKKNIFDFLDSLICIYIYVFYLVLYRWRMNKGFPLHLKTMLCPSGMLLSFTSILETAKTSAEAAIELRRP